MSHPRGAWALDAWDRFWFGSGSLLNLAALRIALSAAALYGIYRYAGAVFQDAGPNQLAYLERSWTPIYALEVLHIGPLGLGALSAIFVLANLSITATLLGLFTRYSAVVAAGTVFLWVGHHYSHGKPHHEFIALMFGLCALPLAPSGARLSIDAWSARRRDSPGRERETQPLRAAGARLPVHLTQLSIALGYFFAGASKLAIGGWEWLNGYTLQGITLNFDAPWGDWVAGHRLGCQLMSIGLVFVQTSFPLIFLHKSLRWFYVPSAILFHLVAAQTMSTGLFVTLWFTLAAFVDWEQLAPWWRKRLDSRARWPLILSVALAASALFSIYFAVVPKAFVLLALIPLVLWRLGRPDAQDRSPIQCSPPG